MKLTTDCSFHIGAQHLRSGLPCQDYATADTDVVGGAYAIVSDGCSSGGKTDVGARLSALMLGSDLKKGRRWLRSDSFVDLGLALGLQPDDMLATMVVARVGDGAAFFQVAGDGVIAAVNLDGSVAMTRIEWANNMPWYPVYHRFGEENFIAAHAGRPDAFALETWEARAGDMTLVNTLKLPVSQQFGQAGYVVAYDITKVCCLAVFSDGVCQVGELQWQNVVLDLLAYRSKVGDFVKRRMNRFLRDADEAPLDDIACAAILVEHESGNGAS